MMSFTFVDTLLCPPFQSRQVSVETVIGLADRFAVEPFLAATRFIPRHKQHGPALRIESKSHSPLASSRAEAQFLHIRVAGTVQRIHARPPQLWPELIKQARQCQ